MALNWRKNDYFSILLHPDKRSHAALEMFVDDLHADKDSTINKFLGHSGSEDFLWGLARLLGNDNSRVAGNAAYILGTLAESEFGCLRVISLTSNKSGETSKILIDLTNMLTFSDSESVMNAAGTLGTLAESHEGRQWMLKEECLGETLTWTTNLLSSDNLWTASNAALVLARLTIAEEGCEQLLLHEDSADILTKLTASLGVDEAGRGMNAAFAIGRLCDMETGRKRLLGLPDSEKMIIALAKMLCCNDAGASKNACFALSCLATNKEGHGRILKNSRSDEVLRTLTELLSADDAETGWFAAMTLRTLASQPKGCLRLRGNPFILPALQSAEKRDDVSEDLRDEVIQTLSILKLLGRPKNVHVEETSEGLNISWEEVTTKSGFQVRYQLYEGEKCVYEGNSISHAMKNIQPFTQYSYKVRAYTDGDESPFSEVVSFITQEGVPGLPQNVRVTGTTTTLLKVGWEPPLETNGQLKGYYVYNGDNLVEHTCELSSILSGLTPKTTYEISVCACTAKGKGPREHTLGSTLDSGDHCPSKPEILVRGRSELYVSWRPPEVPQGKLSRYDLSMNGEVIYSGTDLHFTVLRLKPETEYTFTISSITTEGKFESKVAKKKTAKDEYEGERAPLYQPPPKKEVQIEEPVREDGETRISDIPISTKKRKSIVGASSHGDGPKTRSASARSKRRNSQSKEAESSKKDEMNDLNGRRDSYPKTANDERGDGSHVFAWENSLRNYTQIEMLQKSRVSSSKSRRSEVRNEPDVPLYRSATTLTREPRPRHDFPKPKPPPLKPALGPGRHTKSLEYNRDESYRTSAVAARQSAQSKSNRIRAIQNPENVVSDFRRNRRVRSNTWAFDRAGPRREVTLLELNNSGEGSLSGRSYRINSDSYNEGQTAQKADRLAISADETKSSEQLKRKQESDTGVSHPVDTLPERLQHSAHHLLNPGLENLVATSMMRAQAFVASHRPTVGRRYMEHHVTTSNTPALPNSSIPMNPQWKVDLPSSHVAQNHGKFVPMQFRTQPANIPGGMHRQATNLQLYDRGLKVNFITRSKTDLGAVRQTPLSAGLPLPVGGGTGVVPSSSEVVADRNLSGDNSSSPVVQFSAITPFTMTGSKNRGGSSNMEPAPDTRNRPRQSSASLVGQLVLDQSPSNESKLQRAN